MEGELRESVMETLDAIAAEFDAFRRLQEKLVEADTKVMMGSRAGEVAKAEGTQLKTNAVNMLAGFPAQAAGLSGSGANFAASGLGLANSGLAGLNSGATSASTMAGQWGSNATGMFNAQANYKLAADRAANDADPFASLLGAGAKLGAAAIGKWG